jgi:hypothetical protein
MRSIVAILMVRSDANSFGIVIAGRAAISGEG